MSRYDQLIALVEHNKPKTIIEVGTWNGDRALQMVIAALKHHDEVRYTGFDLFTQATDETDAVELNVKKHFTMAEVSEKFTAFANGLPEGKKFHFELVEGNTNETLKGLCAEIAGPIMADFAFIDGGHSVETIKSDYECLKECKTVVLDDFYQKDANGNGPDIEKFGCNAILGGKPALILSAADPVMGGGLVRMAVIPKTNVPEGMGREVRQNLVIQTKNCVDVSEIQGNIKHALSLDPPRWPNLVMGHDRHAVVCSAGPSLETYLDDIRNFQDTGSLVACVKHAHDRLINKGIIPWACILLDPRGHVRDFIAEPHPDVNYAVASMCHPSTFETLMSKGAKVWIYHAAVGADENEILKHSGKPEWVVGGGSSSAVRGLSVMHMAGFRNFDCYGYDSSFPEKPKRIKKDKNGRPAMFDLEVNGRTFTTDYEKLAEVQDWEKARKGGFSANIKLHGYGMIPHIERIMRRNANEAFRRAFDGARASD